MRIDQYESQFKSAVKERFKYSEPEITKVVLITDYNQARSEELAKVSKRLLPTWAVPDWTVLNEDSYSSVKELLNKINLIEPELIICPRNLKTSNDNLVYGLSDYPDALTQVTSCPVLLLPDSSLEDLKTKLQPIKDIVVETDHLTGDAKLISWGTAFARPSGSLLLTHIEDDKTFSYYIDAISKIPEIDTAVAKEKLKAELIKVPSDYINEAKEILKLEFKDLLIKGIVKLGHTLDDYKSILDSQNVDLLIINTKVEGQLAMSGRAYALSVELKQLPLLLL